MVCVKKSSDQMLIEIGNYKKIRDDTIIPIDFLDEIVREKNPYIWLWIYINKLDSFLKTLKELPIKINFGRGVSNPIQSALENAYVHALGTGGKTSNAKLPINLRIFLGEFGVLFSIIDSGIGFDFNSVLEKKNSGEIYYNALNGDGFYQYDLEGFEVSGEKNRINILYKF